MREGEGAGEGEREQGRGKERGRGGKSERRGGRRREGEEREREREKEREREREREREKEREGKSEFSNYPSSLQGHPHLAEILESIRILLLRKTWHQLQMFVLCNNELLPESTKHRERHSQPPFTCMHL